MCVCALNSLLIKDGGHHVLPSLCKCACLMSNHTTLLVVQVPQFKGFSSLLMNGAHISLLFRFLNFGQCLLYFWFYIAHFSSFSSSELLSCPLSCWFMVPNIATDTPVALVESQFFKQHLELSICMWIIFCHSE